MIVIPRGASTCGTTRRSRSRWTARRKPCGPGLPRPRRTRSSRRVSSPPTPPASHKEGNYFAHPETLSLLEEEGRVVLRYLENPNGSANDIAGICNEDRNVVGIMPHPERVSDPALGSDEGLRILLSVLVGAGV